ncbi:MAG TPA: metal-dependent transcriptional regulator [Anaerolineales bacterium]|nr:metal-dependent transcriptional regulator [Anaerolineales bacterium]HNB41432.1 metal-dependent transcriptional regulator [Anaerolineales bacterium]HND48044.1 metal-dependent transcriptional regulator [Anaerolineales bacterium]HNE04211.1 metal-dependent transcriptional regulator [Anaerolineales bacterium]HNF93583.1 metal-dependent transcriptional regulator [Anaerolineales bacterium]
MKTSTSIQDYLKRIYELTESGQSASTNDLARELKVKPASVTGMIQKLAAETPALVEYQKHQGVTLTVAGKRAALEVIRHHRLLETWLVQTLGYSWDEVHEEAERLEHVISEDFERRIAAALGHPLRDPHGELIPTEDLKMPLDESTPLSALRKDQSGTILCIKAADADLLRHLTELGLTPNTFIQVTEYSPYDHNLTIRVDKKTHVLGLSITSKIFIEEG